MRGCATLLLLDVPTGTVIGIDKKKHISGPRFKGIKMVPPGTHIVTFNSIGSQGDFSPTMSFFAYLKAGEVVVRRWQASSEMLKPLHDEDEVARYQRGVEGFDFDSGLGQYDLAAYAEWQALTSCIDAQTVASFISITAEAAPASDSQAEEQLSAQLSRADLCGNPSCSEAGLPDSPRSPPAPQDTKYEPDVGRCYYTPIPRHVKVEGRTPSEVTAASLDKSELLESLIEHDYAREEKGLVGELQFAFLAFFIGQSLEGFQQWKRILHLILSCEAAPMGNKSALYVKLLNALEVQLRSSLGASQSAGDGNGEPDTGPLGVPMVDELLADSFLRQLFSQFFEGLTDAESPLVPDLQAAVASLQSVLEKELGWSFQIEELRAYASDDEYAPVFVET